MSKTILMSASMAGEASTASTSTFYKWTGYLHSQTVSTSCDVKIRSAGTITKLFARVSTNTSSGANTLRSNKNGSNGNQSVSIGTAATGTFQDTTNSDTIAAGDLTCINYAQTTTGVTTFLVMAGVFDATTDTVTIHANANSITSLSSASTTYYLPPAGRIYVNTTESQAKYRIREAGTYKYLGTNLSTNSRTTNTVWRSRKNGANGNLTLTFGSGVTGWQEDTTNSDTVAAGDDYNVSITNGTGTQTYNYKVHKLEFISTAGDSLIHASGTPAAYTAGQTRWIPVSGDIGNTSTETNGQIDPTFTCTATEMLCLVTANSITSGTTTLTSRVNTAAGNQTVTITNSTTGLFGDTTHSDSLVSGDDYILQITAGTGTSVTISWVSTGFNSNTAINYTRTMTAETISISEAAYTRLYGANRAPTAETISIGESQARAVTNTRAIAAQTTTIGESLARLYGANRALSTETVTIGESLARIYGANRAPATETVTIGESLAKVQVLTRALAAETTAISESLARTRGANRPLTTETVAISESLARILGAVRALSTETVAVSESQTRLLSAIRALATQTVTIGESLARTYNANRSLTTETVAISESLARLIGFTRALATETVTIGESLSRTLGANRSLTTETIAVSESLNRLLGAIRTLSDTVTIGESLTKVYTPAGGGAFDRPLSPETVAISESLTRAVTVTRTLLDIVGISESLARLYNGVRSLSDTTGISESLARSLSFTRSLSDTLGISEALNKVQSLVRTLSDSIDITETLERAVANTRAIIVETVTITEQLVSALTGQEFVRTIIESAVNITDSVATTIVYTVRKVIQEKVVRAESVPRKNRAHNIEPYSEVGVGNWIRKQADKLRGRKYGTGRRSRYG